MFQRPGTIKQKMIYVPSVDVSAKFSLITRYRDSLRDFGDTRRFVNFMWTECSIQVWVELKYIVEKGREAYPVATWRSRGGRKARRIHMSYEMQQSESLLR
jgi:hypothetical protein